MDMSKCLGFGFNGGATMIEKHTRVVAPKENFFYEFYSLYSSSN